MSNNVVALDVGAKRIGVAFAADGLSIARSLPTLTNDSEVINNLKSIVTDKSASKLVIGLPRSLDGNDTEQTTYVKRFSSQVESELNLPVVFQDEALSSMQAKDNLAKMGRKIEKGDIDSLAAMTILQDYLDEKG